MFAFHATMMSNTLGTSIVVFTGTGFMAILLSRAQYFLSQMSDSSMTPLKTTMYYNSADRNDIVSGLWYIYENGWIVSLQKLLSDVVFLLRSFKRGIGDP